MKHSPVQTQASEPARQVDGSSPVTFFETALRTFEKAAAAAGLIHRDYQVGDSTVRLCFAGPAFLPRITPALEHLGVQSAARPALTVCIFDNESTGTVMPPPPWTPDCYGPRGEIRGFNTERIHTTYEPGVDLLHVLDVERAMAVYWTLSHKLVPYWESSFPMRVILHWWLRDSPCQPIHAGAVGGPSGGVLVAGRSGSGKSTATLACLDSNLLYAGDDYVLARTEPSPFVYSLYSTAKLDPDNVHRLPHLRRFIRNPDCLDRQKALIFLNECYPQKLTRGFPIRAILVPRVTGLRDTRLTRTTPMAGLKAIAPTTILHLQGASAEALRKLANLARQAPSYNLEVGTDLSQIPAVISDLLRKGER